MSAAPVSLSEPLMTAADVALLLCVPRSSVYEYARRQHDPLPTIGIGRHRRFLRSDVELWLATQRTGNRRRPPARRSSLTHGLERTGAGARGVSYARSGLRAATRLPDRQKRSTVDGRLDQAISRAAQFPQIGGHVAELALQGGEGFAIASTVEPGHLSLWGAAVKLDGAIVDVYPVEQP